MNISPVSNIQQTLSPRQSGAVKKANFGSLIKHYIQQTNTEVKTAAKAGLDLTTGKSKNVSETLVAIEKANVSFKLMLGVRNKLMAAYTEIMHMQA